MTRYLLRRLAQAAFVVAGVVVLTFVVMRLVPGDPAVTYAGPRASAAELARTRAELGLDDTLPVQLWDYLSSLVQGDWGISLHTRQDVLGDISTAFPASLELVGTGVIIAVLVGIPLGVLAARFRGRPADGSIRITSMAGVSVPVFLLALFAQNVFATKLGWLPVAGEYDPSLDGTSPLHLYTNITAVDALITGNWPILGSTLAHLALPAAAIAAYPTGVVAQMTRAALIEESTQNHARLERALGFTRWQVLTRFSLRPALSPVLALLALVFAFSLVNAFLVEAIFNWPGLGRYAADSIRSSDAPAIAGVTIAIAFTYVVVNLLVDLAQAAIDPRVRIR
ncbi:ABC transporter permease [Actinomadura sp. NPDC048955]|uniref:Peptide/nickel transport system permease protein n=2 Tax=Actinomadura luteofluorescens TaxID=46163 RepID=A0A7Y9EFI7_9ACTN|nr:MULTISPECIES: ABC transporter permease [Actinomadura]MCR3740901.1 peptide/nickel transport system permease protein [Actinomadura glauciflava]NYD46667.1 peptide/nickel transport system permease protein [Actinomadura luteofluorescens]